MPRPMRNEQFSADEVSIVCVRRAFLAGTDDKRRERIRRRMEALASVFGIDVLTYAIMSDHLHVILRNRPDVVAAWSDEEAALRWLRVFPGRWLYEQLAEPTENDVKTLAGNAERMAEIRNRLSDISWFMRALCEPIARLANQQDERTGRFWEGRFRVQRIADEMGLLACAMYVDLNPIRAAIAGTVAQSQQTSAYDRLQGERGVQIDSAAFDLVTITTDEAGKQLRTKSPEQLRSARQAKRRAGKKVRRDSWLSPLMLGRGKLAQDPEVHKHGLRASNKGFLHLAWSDYLALLNWTAKQRTNDEANSRLPSQLQKTLKSLGIEANLWRDLVWNFKRYFGQSCCAGRPESLVADAKRTGKRFHRGQRQLRTAFSDSASSKP